MSVNNSSGVDGNEVQGYKVLSQYIRSMLKRIRKLRDLGVEDSIAIPLAKICLIGNQATGKSSLIEGMRYVKLQARNWV